MTTVLSTNGMKNWKNSRCSRELMQDVIEH